MAGGGGGGEVVPVSPQPSRGGRRRRHKAAAGCLPLYIIVEEIAARSDAATLVRCAATCRDARRRIAEDPDLRGRLRLRDTGRFVLPLLRGHLARRITTSEGGRVKSTVHLVDTTATTVAETEAWAAWLDAVAVPVDSRGGLVLAKATSSQQAQQSRQQLVVWNPVTGRRQDLPPEPEFRQHAGQSTDEKYVLLVGDGKGGAAVGRPFHVLKAKLVLSKRNPRYRRLMVQTFSSEHGGEWSPPTEIPTPNIHGRYISWASPRKAMVTGGGGGVHWLCLTDAGSYVLMLHARAAPARVSVAALPATFPRGDAPGRRSYLLATDSAGGSPVVLVADAEDKDIRAWERCKRTRSKSWSASPQVVVEREAILGFNDDEVKEAIRRCRCNDGMLKNVGREEAEEEEGTTTMLCVPELLWFGERSGAVFLRIHGSCLLRLDLHSKKIVKCFCSDPWYAQVYLFGFYEQDLSSWVPTFNSAVISI